MNFANYTNTALAAVRGAKVEASRMGLPFAGTGHLLLGIAKSGGRGAKVLAKAGVEAQAIKRELHSLLPVTEECDVTCEELGLSGGFRAALDYTQCFTASSKKWIDDMSLLGALWAVSNAMSTASIILKRLGVTWMDLTYVGAEKMDTPAGGQVYGEKEGGSFVGAPIDLTGTASWHCSVSIGPFQKVEDIDRERYEEYMLTAAPASIFTFTANPGKPLTAAEIYKMAEELSKQQPVMLPEKVQYTKIKSLPKEAEFTKFNPPVDLLRETASTIRSLAMEIVHLRFQTALHSVFVGDDAQQKRNEYLKATRKAAENERKRLNKLADKLDSIWEKPKALSWLNEVPRGGFGALPDGGEEKCQYDNYDNLVEALKNFPKVPKSHNVNPDGSFPLPQGVANAVEQEATRVGLLCPEGHHKLEGECRYDYCRCQCPRCTEQCQKHGR